MDRYFRIITGTLTTVLGIRSSRRAAGMAIQRPSWSESLRWVLLHLQQRVSDGALRQARCPVDARPRGNACGRKVRNF